MEILAFIDKETVSFRTEVFAGGWLKLVLNADAFYTPYGFIIPNSSIHNVLAVLENRNDLYDEVTYRSLVITHSGDLIDFKSSPSLNMSVMVMLGHYTKLDGMMTYAPSGDGEGSSMLDLLSQIPGILPRAGIVSTETAVEFFKQRYPMTGYYHTLSIADIVQRLNDLYPEPKLLSHGTRLRSPTGMLKI